uniref:Mother of FT 1 protein n=1 Tax=Oxybasis rubra TaxID=3560 RepID=A0A2Z1YWP0_OXYRB|nr:mother of FT 1 protein [Oxybasis rubra]
MTTMVVRRSIDPLVVGRVIGDVLDMFVPMADFRVQYGTKHIFNGCEIKPSLASERPLVQISGLLSTDNLYTIIMIDPDAPSPSEPKMKEWLHWIIADIPQGMDASKGRELVEYMGPKPPTGIHRYVFVLFRQKGPIAKQWQLPQARNNFSTRNFAARNGLGLPVAAVYFNSQKEAANKKR